MSDEPAFYYYAGGRKLPIEPVDDLVAVAFADRIPERRRDEALAELRPAGALGASPKLLNDNILVHKPSAAAADPGRIDAFVNRLSRAPSVRFVTRVFRDPRTGLRMVLTDELAVRFKPGVTDQQVQALNAQFGVEPIEQKLYAPNQWLMRVIDPTPERTLTVANAYHENELVEWAEPNFIMELQLRFRSRQWHLANTGQSVPSLPAGVIGEDVRAHQAWAITRGSGNVTVAVIDTGVDIPKPGVAGDTGHPGLMINIAPDGANFAGGPPNDPTPDFPDPDGAAGHGTSCAGVVAGAGGRIDGVAPSCKILPIKIDFIDANRVSDAIHYSSQRAQVLSNSWGMPFSNQIEQALGDVIREGREGKGTIVLFACGNDDARVPVADQSTVEGVISIAASTNVGSRAGYSNFGDASDSPNPDPAVRLKRLSVVAPSAGVDSLNAQGLAVGGTPDASSENIFTTDVRGIAGFNPPGPGVTEVADLDYTGLFSGTSSACPLAAGICALMLSVNADLTAGQVKYILEATADKIGTADGRTGVPRSRPNPGEEAIYEPATGYDVRASGLSGYGFGRTNAEKAVKASRGDALPQLMRPETGAPEIRERITLVLDRIPGTDRFVSRQVVELVDARRDADQLSAPDRVFVRGGPGGFLQARYSPPGGGRPMTDDADIEGQL
jgi:subtilisin family serine protease